MTAPTREQVHAWAEETQLSHFACYVIPGFGHRLQRFAELAAGQSGQASGSGAKLVRDVEEAAKSGPLPGGSTGDQIICRQVAQSLVHCDWWPRLRAALLSGDAARDDAERWRMLVPLMAKHPTSSCWFIGPPLEAGDDFVVAFDRARGGK